MYSKISNRKILAKTLSVIIMAVITNVSTATAQESMVTNISYAYLDKLIAMAKANYPEMMVKQYQTEIAKNAITKSSVSYLDAFSLSYFYTPNNSFNLVNPNLFNGYQLGISLNIGTFLQKPFVVKDAKIQYKLTQAQQSEYNKSLEAEVTKRYLTYMEQIAQLKLRSKSYTDAQNLVSQLQHKFEKGETTFDDYSRALLLSTEQNQFMITAEGETLIAKSQLEELIGEKLENVK